MSLLQVSRRNGRSRRDTRICKNCGIRRSVSNTSFTGLWQSGWRHCLRVLMFFFLLALFGLTAVSLMTFVGPTCRAARPSYADPPADWPDIPVESLSLFEPVGRINHPVPMAAQHEFPQKAQTVTSLDEAQELLLSLAPAKTQPPPQIDLRLSPGEEIWTDVLLDNKVVARVPTAVFFAVGKLQAL